MSGEDFERFGDFVVTAEAREEAEEAFQKRSKRSRAIDRATRAPIESDVDKWKQNQRGLDFPGVDTPSAHPTSRALDFPLPAERRRGGGEDVRLMPDPERDPPTVGEELDAITEPIDRLNDIEL